MPVSYNDIVGQHIGRLANLSDSILGVAMTLLILEVKLAADYIETERQLWNALLALGPALSGLFDEFSYPGHFLGCPAGTV